MKKYRIEFDNIDEVPDVFIDGKEISGKAMINYHWETKDLNKLRNNNLTIRYLTEINSSPVINELRESINENKRIY